MSLNKKCKHCKTEFRQYTTLQTMCSDCAVKRAKIVVKKTNDKLAKKRKSEMKERIKSLSDYKRELQKEVNTIVRLIDKDCPCISSCRTNGKMNAGHRYAVGGWDNLRFNLFNIWIQSEADNTHKHGNPSGYDKTLMKYGIYEYVHDLPAIYPFIKLQKVDLQERIKLARSMVKGLILQNETAELPRTPDQRIFLRKIYNKKLNIYL